MLDYSLRTFKYSWRGWNNQGLPGVLQLFKLCAAAVSSRFLYKLEKKKNHPPCYFIFLVLPHYFPPH